MDRISLNLYQSYCPWLMQKFRFRSLSWEQIDRISPNFIYAFILTRSTMGLLHIIFRTFVPVLFPLIYAKISFPFNILKPNGPNFTKLYITFITVKIYVGIVSCHISQICKRVKALIDVRITLPLNILRNSGLSLHAKHCSWAIVRFSDSSSLICFGANSMGMFFHNY